MHGRTCTRPKSFKCCRALMQTLDPSKRPLTDLILHMCHNVYLFALPSGFLSLWLPLVVRKQLRMLSDCIQGNLPAITSSWTVKLSVQKSYMFVRFFNHSMENFAIKVIHDNSRSRTCKWLEQCSVSSSPRD